MLYLVFITKYTLCVHLLWLNKYGFHCISYVLNTVAEWTDFGF